MFSRVLYKQKAIPTLRETLPTMLLCVGQFMLGFVLIVSAANGYVPGHFSFWALAAGMVSCLVVAGCIIIAFPTWRLANQLDVHGLITYGRVLHIQPYEPKWLRLCSGKRYDIINYVFDIANFNHDEQQFVADQRVEVTKGRHLSVGSEIRVRFLPKNPNISRMEWPV